MAERTNLPVDPRRFRRDKARVEDGFWVKMGRTVGRVPFAEEAVSAYYCTVDRDTPLQVKAVLLGALAYFVMPADMIPDFIAGLGFLDDATVLTAAVRSVAPHIKDHHRSRAREALGRDEPAQEAGDSGQTGSRAA